MSQQLTRDQLNVIEDINQFNLLVGTELVVTAFIFILLFDFKWTIFSNHYKYKNSDSDFENKGKIAFYFDFVEKFVFVLAFYLELFLSRTII